MIGVIGPGDSVDLVLATAVEMGIRSRVMGSAYQHPMEAGDIATSLEDLCRVLVFTGWVPFELANRGGASRSTESFFVPHSGPSLYRALALLLIEFKGALPSASIDTIAARDIQETYQEIGEQVPTQMLSTYSADTANQTSPIDAVADFHRAALATGDASLALTCLDAVYQTLAAEGLPVRRIAHTRSAIRVALERAALADDLEQSRATHIAVVLVRTPGGRSEGDHYSVERERLRQRETLLNMGERLKGHLMAIDDHTYIIPTSRGAVENVFSTSVGGRSTVIEESGLPADTELGIGFGPNMNAAEQSARRALELGGHDSNIHMLLPSGTAWSVDNGLNVRTFKATDPRSVALASKLGLGPLSLSRMLEALSRLDCAQVTAGALADEYGVQVRSARRLLTSLRRSGYANEVGTITTARIGRPQVVYKVEISQLAEEAYGWTEHS